MVKVSVAILTYNRKDKLRRLLISLKESTFKDFGINNSIVDLYI